MLPSSSVHVNHINTYKAATWGLEKLTSRKREEGESSTEGERKQMKERTVLIDVYNVPNKPKHTPELGMNTCKLHIKK